MAYVSSTTTQTSGIVGGIVNLYGAVVTELRNRRVYRTTLNELSTLSNRELDDLGITRYDIEQVAYDAAYKA